MWYLGRVAGPDIFYRQHAWFSRCFRNAYSAVIICEMWLVLSNGRPWGAVRVCHNLCAESLDWCLAFRVSSALRIWSAVHLSLLVPFCSCYLSSAFSLTQYFCIPAFG